MWLSERITSFPLKPIVGDPFSPRVLIFLGKEKLLTTFTKLITPDGINKVCLYTFSSKKTTTQSYHVVYAIYFHATSRVKAQAIIIPHIKQIQKLQIFNQTTYVHQQTNKTSAPMQPITTTGQQVHNAKIDLPLNQALSSVIDTELALANQY